MAKSAENIVSDFGGVVNNPLFRAYCFYSAILVLKMLLMSALTARQRFLRKSFANPEDVKLHFPELEPRTDENVERIRRAHLNDLENIPLFLFIAFIYILTNPSETTASLLFNLYTNARIFYTIVYAILVIPQPARAISYFVGYFVTGYMAVRSISYFAAA